LETTPNAKPQPLLEPKQAWRQPPPPLHVKPLPLRPAHRLELLWLQQLPHVKPQPLPLEHKQVWLLLKPLPLVKPLPLPLPHTRELLPLKLLPLARLPPLLPE
jgi:hypothetical protein